MNKGFYSRLAINNIKKNSKTYIPYIFTCIMTVMMFYIMKSLSKNPGISQLIGDETLTTILHLGSVIVGMFSFVFLFYTNSFLMKRRKKEFGVFNILGMEKKHIAKVITIESFFITIISLVLGIIFGIALDKVMFLLIAKMIGAKIPLGFFISGEVIGYTIVFFLILFFLILLKSIYLIRVAKPVELLHGGNVGEKEPKTKWIMTILGIIGLTAGYYIALTTKNPITSIYAFFIAVILVMISTYLLFTAGSIALLKMLKKNKGYYYQTKHFISVSGMIYRMKQNAVGLANICILSTMVLVMISGTTSLMVGFEDIMHSRYPNVFCIYSNEVEESHNEKLVTNLKQLCEEAGISKENEIGYYYMFLSSVREGSYFATDLSEMDMVTAMNNINVLIFSTLKDYNRIMGENKILNTGEILLYSSRDSYGYDTFEIFDREYKVVEVLDKMYENSAVVSNIANAIYVIVPDMEEVKHINDCAVATDENPDLADSGICYYYGFDTSADEDTQITFYSKLKAELSELGYDVSSEFRLENRNGMLGIYGGLFFLGIFLGILFIMATMLIMYYKQISEGFEDRERFQIMQKVGLSRNEVKSAIHSQVLTVFFLPLIVAGIHLTVAFPMISKLLAMINMTNTRLYVTCGVICFVVFAIVYTVIYSLTAKVYYRIVSNG